MLASGNKQPDKVPCAWKSRRKCRKAYNYLIESEQSSYKAFVRRREECIDEAYNFYDYKQRKGVECCLWPHLYPFTSWCETVLDGRESRMSSKVSFKSEITDYGLTHELLHFRYDLWLWQSVSGAIAQGRKQKCSPNKALVFLFHFILLSKISTVYFSVEVKIFDYCFLGCPFKAVI